MEARSGQMTEEGREATVRGKLGPQAVTNC